MKLGSRFGLAWVCALALATACGDDDGDTTDAGPEEDAFVPMEDAGEEDAGPGSTGQVRLWHLADAAGDVDVFVNGEAFLEDFSFEANTAYTELPAGSYDLAVAPADAGIDAAVIEVDGFALGAGETWTIIATQLDADATADGAFAALPILEDTAAPSAGNVKFRLFHAAYAVENEVDVHDLTVLTAPEIAAGLAQGTAADDALDVPVAAYRFGFDVGASAEDLGAPDSIVDLISGALDEPVEGVSITAGVISKEVMEDGETEIENELVFLVGDGENIHDESELEVAANARVWHLAPEAGLVDVYLNGALALEDFAFEANTPYLPFLPGTVDIAVAVADDPIDDAVIEVDDYALDEGTFHTIVAWQQDADEGAAGAFQPLAIVEDREPPADGNIKVRVFHVSYLVGNAVDVYDMADDTAPVLSGLAQGAVSDDALEVPNGAYTFGIDIDDPADGTVDLEMGVPLDMPLNGSFVTLGVLTKPDGTGDETEVVFLVNNGIQEEVELEAP